MAMACPQADYLVVDRNGTRHRASGSRSWASRKVGDLDRMRYRRGLVALCNHAECGMSVHFAPLIASCLL